MKRKFFAVFISIIGLLTVGSAIFAQLLGIDHNAEWGRGRILLLTIGLCVFFAGTLSFIFGSRGVVSRENPANVFVVKLGQKYLYILPVAGFILLVYIWFASVGLWATWPERTAYYSLLARAFQNRDLHLPVAPSEKLLALPNPYDPSQRVGVGEPLDFSLYNGKFYLYWGPIPALILVALKVLTPKDLPDVHLVFGFSCGLFLVQSLLIVAIWDRFFERLPKWILAMAVLLVGLSAPVTWMLSTGRIYEVAITGGQFFLMAGFLATIFALDKTFLSNMKLFLAGTLWSLAIGSRLTLILPIGFMILMVIYRLWQTRPVKLRDITHALLWLGLPLLSGLLLLASYNWARFGSLTETGLTYQLAGTYIQKHLDEMVSYRYIIQNFYN